MMTENNEFVSRQYESQADFERALQSFSTQTFQLFSIRSSKENKDTETRARFDKKSMRYECVHYGLPRKNPHKKNLRLIKTMHTGCTAHFNVKLCRSKEANDGNNFVLKIVSSHFVHNHPVDEASFMMYARNRRLEPQDAEYASILLQIGNRKEIKRLLEAKTNKVITTKDLNNLKSRFRIMPTEGQTLNQSEDAQFEALGEEEEEEEGEEAFGEYNVEEMNDNSYNYSDLSKVVMGLNDKSIQTDPEPVQMNSSCKCCCTCNNKNKKRQSEPNGTEHAQKYIRLDLDYNYDSD